MKVKKIFIFIKNLFVRKSFEQEFLELNELINHPLTQRAVWFDHIEKVKKEIK